jgi:ankyrin repeat protein
MRVLVEHGADVNTPMQNGSTLVFIAAEKGHVDVIKTLVEHGADVNTSNDNGLTPVWIAAQNGHVNVFHSLIEHGANVNTPAENNVTPVWIAAQNGHVEVINVLVDHGANINTSDDNGTTPLWKAARYGHLDCVRALVKIGGDDNTSNMEDATPVSMATDMNNVAMVRVLVLELGADVNICDVDGRSPVYYAAEDGHTGMLTFLMKIGADITQLLDLDDFEMPANLQTMLSKMPEKLHTVASVYVLFSLSKLMTSVMRNTIAADDDIDDYVIDDANDEFGTQIFVSCFCPHLEYAALTHSTATPYPLKRKLCRLAYRVYLETLLFDGERISLSTKARRYVELVCFFLNQVMLTDVCALRMTCKSNHLIRRFPIYYSTYRELEANLIEGFVGYDACRFVSTSQVHQIIAMHW